MGAFYPPHWVWRHLYYLGKAPGCLKRYKTRRGKREQKYEQLKQDGMIYCLEKEGQFVKFFLPLVSSADKGDYIQYSIFLHDQFYEENILDYVREHYLRDGMNILDCGANIGNHTLYFSKIAHVKEVFSFEAAPDTYEILQKNIIINGLGESCRAYNYALGEAAGMAAIDFRNEENIGNTSIAVNDTGNIRMIRIDDLELPKIDFVKIDVEGFELHVLKGMESLLNRDRPLIWVETFEGMYESVKTFLSSLGYVEDRAFGGDNFIFCWKD